MTFTLCSYNIFICASYVRYRHWANKCSSCTYIILEMQKSEFNIFSLLSYTPHLQRIRGFPTKYTRLKVICDFSNAQYFFACISHYYLFVNANVYLFCNISIWILFASAYSQSGLHVRTNNFELVCTLIKIDFSLSYEYRNLESKVNCFK